MDSVWDSMGFVSMFSLLVVIADEWRYRRRKRRLRKGTKAVVLTLRRRVPPLAPRSRARRMRLR